MTAKLLTAEQVRKMLRTACDASGGLRAWSRTHNVSVAYVSRVMRGEKDIGDSIARGLGLTKNVVWTVDKRRGRE